MKTAYRKLLEFLPRLGVQVLDLGPGASVVARRGGYVRVSVGDGVDVVARRRHRKSVRRVGKDVWMVGERANGVSELVTSLLDAQVTADDERPFQLAAAKYLCNHHVAGLLRQYGVNCVFDVGANSGQYAKGLRRAGYTGRIVSFEPVTATYQKLQRASESDENWTVFPFALGSTESVQEIHVEWNSMNSLLPPSDYGKGRYKRFAKGRTEEIDIRRLDSVMDKAMDGLTDPRPYLKMDTQGFDLEVFAGAGERIKEFVGLQSEVALLQLYEGSPGMGEAITKYQDGGFEITGMYPVTREDTTGRIVEFDCVMMRAEAAPTKE
ncbi:FkbM family methyltransferase [Streptomyces cavernae]|uniref:FkbM family methyltransferase n=1 Tax=Streptomyces cavernae TaxID=2259034 RepID=UPI000FEBDDA9|nr:FkbM family methyltransferase [Streptomyces cavernae]